MSFSEIFPFRARFAEAVSNLCQTLGVQTLGTTPNPNYLLIIQDECMIDQSIFQPQIRLY